jgi:hypothetical protein
MFTLLDNKYKKILVPAMVHLKNNMHKLLATYDLDIKRIEVIIKKRCKNNGHILFHNQ